MVFAFLLAGMFIASKMIVWHSPPRLKNWKNIFLESIPGFDEMIVCPMRNDDPIFMLQDADDLQVFLDTMQIDEAKSETVFMAGDMRFIFKGKSKPVQVLELVGESHLRWRNGNWPSDAKLTDDSAHRLKEWLISKGIELEEGDLSP